MTRIMKIQASSRPTLKRALSGFSRGTGVVGSSVVAIGGVVTVAISASSGQVRRLGPGEPVLSEGDDHQDEQQADRHGGGVTELEPSERDVVDVVLQHPRRVHRTAL